MEHPKRIKISLPCLSYELDMIGINLIEHIIVDNISFNPVLKDIRTVQNIKNFVNIDKFYNDDIANNGKEEEK